MTNTLTWVEHLWLTLCCLDISSGWSLYSMTGDLSAVWTAPLAGVWVFGAGYQHEACGEQDLSVVWTSGHFLWLESGCLVLGANMKHVENKTSAVEICCLDIRLQAVFNGQHTMQPVPSFLCCPDIFSGWSLGLWSLVPACSQHLDNKVLISSDGLKVNGSVSHTLEI